MSFSLRPGDDLARSVLRTVVAVCVSLSNGGAAVASAVPFDSIVNVTTNSLGAQSPAAADIDGDGDLDLLTVAREDDEVIWWENAFGVFLEHPLNDSSTDAFDGASWVAAADVDGDGDLDVVASADLDGDVAWFENDGTPATDFWTKRFIDSAFDGAFHVVPADVDRDGDLDVVGAGFLADAVVWWENDGSPLDGGGAVGGEWLRRDVGTAFDGAAFVVPFDFDEDGDLDLIGAAALDHDIAWWENDGDPVAGAWTDRTIAGSFDDVRTIRVADLDGDGDPDLVGSSRGLDRIGWLENDTGDPKTAAWTPRNLTNSFDMAYGLAIADLDRDGDLDVVAAGEAENETAWWENDGSPADGGWTRRLIQSLTGARGVAVADLDGDGDPDVLGASNSQATVGWSSNVTVHRGALFVEEAEVANALLGLPEIVAAADLDGDGDPDLLTNGSLVYRENDGAAAGWIPRTISASDAKHAAAGDLDGDGDLDVAGSAGGEIRWWENDGTPGDGAWTDRLIDDDLANQIVTAVRVADIDRDGDLDVIAADLSLTMNGGVLAWWENDGTPSDGGWTEHLVEDDSLTDPRDLVIADLDGDGHLDLVSSAQNDGLVSWWENDGTPGDGGAAAGGNWTQVTITGAIGPFGVGVGDVGGDGPLDVLATDAFGNIYYRPNTNGDAMTWSGVFSIRDIGASTNTVAPRAIAVADLDLDGDLDVLFAQGNDQRLAWLERPEPIGFNWSEVELADDFAAVAAIAVADFDRDGDPDVAAIGGSGGAGRVRFWRNEGGQFALATTDTAPANLAAGADDDVFEILATHRGRTGDADVELATLEVLLETADGVPLTDLEADGLFASIAVYLDDGSQVYDGADTQVVAATPPFSLSNARLTVAFADGDPNAQIAPGAPKTYFVVAELDPAAAGSFRFTHLTETSSTAEDADTDAPLVLEWTPNVVSSGVVAGVGPTCYPLTLAVTGSGAALGASPDTSVGCPPGELAEGVPVSLTAAPDPGYVVTAWAGTDDDAATTTTNTVTMPASATAVTVTYGLAFDLLIENEEFSSAAAREACNTITTGDAVTVAAAGDLTLRAPVTIVMRDGLTADGSLTLDLGTPSECP